MELSRFLQAGIFSRISHESIYSMPKRSQINIRIDNFQKSKWIAAMQDDRTTPDLTTWIKKQCDAATRRYEKRKSKNRGK